MNLWGYLDYKHSPLPFSYATYDSYYLQNYGQRNNLHRWLMHCFIPVLFATTDASLIKKISFIFDEQEVHIMQSIMDVCLSYKLTHCTNHIYWRKINFIWITPYKHNNASTSLVSKPHSLIFQTNIHKYNKTVLISMYKTQPLWALSIKRHS